MLQASTCLNIEVRSLEYNVVLGANDARCFWDFLESGHHARSYFYRLAKMMENTRFYKEVESPHSAGKSTSARPKTEYCWSYGNYEDAAHSRFRALLWCI